MVKTYPQAVSNQVADWMKDVGSGPLHVVVKRGLAETVSKDLTSLKKATVEKITALLQQQNLGGTDIQVVIANTDEEYVDALMAKESAEETAKTAAKAPTVSSEALSDSSSGMKPVQTGAITQEQPPVMTNEGTQAPAKANRLTQAEALTGAAAAAKDLVRKYMRRPR